MGSASATIGLFSGVGILIYLGLIGLSIYCLILFIRLAHRGIQALDLYIEEKRQNRL
jgi:hypothetical protein